MEKAPFIEFPLSERSNYPDSYSNFAFNYELFLREIDLVKDLTLEGVSGEGHWPHHVVGGGGGGSEVRYGHHLARPKIFFRIFAHTHSLRFQPKTRRRIIFGHSPLSSLSFAPKTS